MSAAPNDYAALVDICTTLRNKGTDAAATELAAHRLSERKRILEYLESESARLLALGLDDCPDHVVDNIIDHIEGWT